MEPQAVQTVTQKTKAERDQRFEALENKATKDDSE